MTDEAYVDWVEIYRDAAGEYRWRAKAGNGETVADSGEGYVDHHGAGRAALALFPNTAIRGDGDRDLDAWAAEQN